MKKIIRELTAQKWHGSMESYTVTETFICHVIEFTVPLVRNHMGGWVSAQGVVRLE